MGEPSDVSRVRRPRQAARDWYDALSPWYEAVAGPFERASREAGLALLAPAAGERIADVGCGPGPALVPLARAVGDDGRVVGVDVAGGMCRQSRRAAAGAGVSDRVDVVCGDALHLPFRAGGLDAAFMSFSLELFDTPDLPRVLDECRRVLGSDGRLGVVSLSKGDAGPATACYERAHDAFPRALDCRPIFVRETLREAGFDLVAARDRTMVGLAVEVVVARV